MALANPTLRDPGATPGSVAGWTITSLCQAQRLAAFGPDPATAIEDFERWASFETSFPDGTSIVGFFDANADGYEGFEGGWTTSTFVAAFSDALLDAYPFTNGVEALEMGWLPSPFVAAWSDVAADVGLFGGAPQDGFEAWGATPPTTWGSAMFDAGAATGEAFAGTWTAMKSL